MKQAKIKYQKKPVVKSNYDNDEEEMMELLDRYYFYCNGAYYEDDIYD